MSYVHNGKVPVELRDDPMTPESEDWVYFVFGGFLRENETITDIAAEVSGGELVVDATPLGEITDPCGNTYLNVYGIKVKAIETSSTVQVTVTFSTSVTGDVDIGRTNVSRTAIIPVAVM